MSHRRALVLGAFAGAIVPGAPSVAQPASFRVGWIGPGTMAEAQPLLEHLRQGLRDLGYVEGRNLVIEARWGEHSPAQVEAQVAALVASKPQVIVALGPVTTAVHKATSTIPVVFAFSGDPVQAGFAESFARPGGNLTGLSFLALDLVGKRIELLKAVMPALKRIAILANAQHPGDPAERRASELAARAMGLEIEYFEVAGARQLDPALEAIARSRCEAVVMFPIQSIISNSARIAAWSLKHRLPAVSGWAQFAEEGNLMSYGARARESFLRIASYVDRVLKGANPGELPIELPRHIELVINLKAAKALGVTVPPAVLLRADKVIE
jgi:putative ABC transport system substrate-binding protein